jgi:Raf kinase inhibitor-like YbhB/YbcL family protein
MRSLSILSLVSMLVVTLAAPASAQTKGFVLSSPDIKNGAIAPAQVYNSFGCSGGNVSPQLVWTGAPEGTKSFVLTVFDPDAPTGSGFWHWVVANIPAGTPGLSNGASRTAKMPAGSIETRTDFGAPGYGGPCPPPGAPHRYVFTLYALKVAKIDVTKDSSGALVGFNTLANSIAKATFTATYGR